jgi:hypothetical protein
MTSLGKIDPSQVCVVTTVAGAPPKDDPQTEVKKKFINITEKAGRVVKDRLSVVRDLLLNTVEIEAKALLKRVENNSTETAVGGCINHDVTKKLSELNSASCSAMQLKGLIKELFALMSSEGMALSSDQQMFTLIQKIELWMEKAVPLADKAEKQNSDLRAMLKAYSECKLCQEIK